MKIINAVAPTRLCDIGGWTDTWFADYGNIFNVAIYPYVEVQVMVGDSATKTISKNSLERKGRMKIHLENFNDKIEIDSSCDLCENCDYKDYPLIRAAIESIDLPPNTNLEINIYSSMPPGASTGTSGAISVALIGALDALTSGPNNRLSASKIAKIAHEVETVKLKQQSGIQDQLCSAHGGINFIEMTKYPNADVTPVRVSDDIWWGLESRLMLVYIGAPHNSSQVHMQVIESLGAKAHDDYKLATTVPEHKYLVKLRQLATDAKNSLIAGNFKKLGRVMNENTDTQRQMNPKLVCDKFEQIIKTANKFGALGCKVNGAGGDGGTVTILCDGDMSRKRELACQIVKQMPGCEVIPIYLARHGLRVWEEDV